MKKLIVLSLALAGTIIVHAQCHQRVILTASKTQYLDASKSVQRTVDEKTRIEISTDSIVIAPGNNEKMKGSITSNKCAWTKHFKEGKSVIKALFSEAHDEKNVTITIEGKDGKVTFLVEVDGQPDKKILLEPDTFEGKK